jgi:hypothetical protein
MENNVVQQILLRFSVSVFSFTDLVGKNKPGSRCGYSVIEEYRPAIAAKTPDSPNPTVARSLTPPGKTA